MALTRWPSSSAASPSEGERGETEFLATMGHENPHADDLACFGMTELLLRTPLDPTQQSYAHTILDSGRMMLRLVNDSLDLARIEAGKLRPSRIEPFDLRKLIAGTAAIAGPLAHNKGLGMMDRAGAPDAPRFVRGDQGSRQADTPEPSEQCDQFH